MVIPAAALGDRGETQGLVTVDILGAMPRGSPAAEVAKWEIRKKLRKFHGP